MYWNHESLEPTCVLSRPIKKLRRSVPPSGNLMRVQSALVASEHAAQSQIGNLEFAPAADEEVGGLKISVHYAVVV